MIRDRLKNVARKAAVKLFKMEFDVEEREGVKRTKTEFDPDKIPKVVDGSGDTPGPNNKTDIGRTWTAAQLTSGVSAVFIDIRPPAEVATGMLPGALLFPGESLKSNLARLPAKTERVTIYDQTGALGSAELAAWLREQGWVMARRLQGGFAEWLEHGETIVQPQPVGGSRYKAGDSVRLKDGRKGWVTEVALSEGTIRYSLWLEGGQLETSVGADGLA